jgi:hypothetical protein
MAKMQVMEFDIMQFYLVSPDFILNKCEPWFFNLKEEQILRVFENKVLKGIHDYKKSNKKNVKPTGF